MGSGFSKMKKQARALQEKFQLMQSEMQNKNFEGSAGNGLVKIVLNGEKNLKNITLQPDCVTPDDVEGLQDLIVAAFNEAASKVDAEKEANGSGKLPF